MRARNCLCSLTLGALAISVSVYAAPRDGATARGKEQGRPDSLRVLTGSDAQLRSTLDEGSVAGGCVTFNVVAVNPYAGGGSYPAGTTGAGTNTLTLPGGSAQRVWLELRISNWACAGDMATWQAQLGPEGVLPAGIVKPFQACAANIDCHNAGMGPGVGADCGGGVPGECDVAFEQQVAQQPSALNFQIEACSPNTFSCGGTQIADPPVADDGAAHYAMSLVVEVTAGYTGSANIAVQNLGADTFFRTAAGDVTIGQAIGATVNVPLGRCCSASGGPCSEDVPRGSCPGAAGLWSQGGICPENGGPLCAECFTAGECPQDAAGACTTNTCESLLCVYTPTGCYGGPGDAECCNPATGMCAARADALACTDDSCSADDAASLGTPVHTASGSGAPCDDDNLCTYDDECDGVSTTGCSGTNVNGDPCSTDADCTNGGDTPGAVCDIPATAGGGGGPLGECSCTLEPDLNFVIDPGTKEDQNCFAVNEKISVAIHVGSAAQTINGGQFAIAYDPACLDFVSIGPAGAPYTNEIQENVNEAAGTIFYAIGIALGGAGNAGNSDMAIISFLKKGGCTECDLCFTDNNPLHTYLVDDTGQPVGVTEKCSKEIRQSPTVVVSGPPEYTKVNVGCDSAVGCVTWSAPTATSDCENVVLTCTGEHLESGCTAGNCCGGTRNGLACTSNAFGQCPLGTCFPSATSGGCFPVGNTNFCCSAGNSCGNTDDHCWTVTVNDATALDVEIQLSPTMASKPGGGITRCIKFEVFSNCVQSPLVFEEDIVFGGLFQLIGHFNSAIKIPSQVQPECITARDQLHTLRSCYLFDGDGSDCDDDGVLHATFKGDPFFGGNWLIGGNLDGWKKDNPIASHDVIDILDFGQMAAQWMTDYGTGNTPCGYEGANADINGDGIADMLDYSFVAINFLEDSKDCCCPGSASLGNRNGRTEISVAELTRNNLKDLTVADLNNDGMVNLQDMAALLQGVRPTRQAPDRDNGKGTNGSRSINR